MAKCRKNRIPNVQPAERIGAIEMSETSEWIIVFVVVAIIVVAFLFLIIPKGPTDRVCDSIFGDAGWFEYDSVELKGDYYCVKKINDNDGVMIRVLKYDNRWQPAKDFIEIEGGLIPKKDIKDLIK